MSETKGQLVQCFGKKKNAVAVATVRAGKGVFRVNGSPVDLLEPQALRVKVMEPVLLLGLQRFQNLDIRVRVRGSGYVSQIYAIRQAIAKGVVAYYQKFVNESEKRQIKGNYWFMQRPSSSTTGACSLPTPEGVSPRSTVDPVPVPESRNLTGEQDVYNLYNPHYSPISSYLYPFAYICQSLWLRAVILEKHTRVMDHFRP